MPKLPIVSGKECVNCLAKLGYTMVRQRGSHVILKKQISEGEIGCVVPLHKELAVGTLRGILKQAKLGVDEFMENL